MKKLILLLMAISVISTSCKDRDQGNPFLKPYGTLHDTPPFSKIKLEHYLPAFEEGIAQSRAEVEAIVNNPDAPTFANTIEALDRQGELLTRVASAFFNLNSAQTSDEMEAIANEVQPKLIELANDVMLNEKLFARVKAVYDATYESGDYDAEQRMLLEKTYKGFTRNGAGLSEADKEKYRAITSELGSLSLLFSQHVRAATNAYTLNIPPADSARIADLPAFVKESLAAEAAERGEQGWTITLQQPSFVPVMTFSSDRELKKEIMMARGTLCYTDGPDDNRTITKRIAELSLQMANLLGYPTYADYVLEEKMARTLPTVRGFMDELIAATRTWAEEEYREVSEYANQMSEGKITLERWDFGYFSEKLKQHRYNISQEEIKPYFRLENAEKGIFMLAEKLYGITFKLNTEIEGYHPDVKAYEVFDADGSFLAVLYMDYFPRESKRSGAWMTSFRDMYTTADGVEVRPLVTCCFNFTKPSGETPSLLTFDEVETLLHEFGHALHGILAKGRYASLTGTGVYHDFVELPSQIMENWATERDFLDMWAEHYQTGEKMPAELIGKIVNSKGFLAAYNNLQQLSYGLNDIAWYSITEPVTVDPGVFERNATAKAQIMPMIEGTCISTSFNHIFGGGYAAGYYGYKWAEVLDADAFSLFKENGIFDRATAQSFRDNVLSKGGSEAPMDLYVRFRGHEPSTAALIKEIGENHH